MRKWTIIVNLQRDGENNMNLFVNLYLRVLAMASCLQDDEWTGSLEPPAKRERVILERY